MKVAVTVEVTQVTVTVTGRLFNYFSVRFYHLFQNIRRCTEIMRTMKQQQLIDRTRDDKVENTTVINCSWERIKMSSKFSFNPCRTVRPIWRGEKYRSSSSSR